MFFKVINCSNEAVYKKLTKIRALAKIKKFPMRQNELVLDNYFKTNFNKSFKEICALLVLRAKFCDNIDSTVIITWSEKKYEDLLNFIIYGSGKIKGSTIFQYIFK